ncbi:thiol reductant ABC exporter subunit CydD [Sporosarcina limicola]|uniref:ATP-binding cassette subfamily C protein CydD n=1 Tax=Sporosarcina limicola TaxID=34101 RepID=A0A927MR97_9BACL|nr:thiol reductant ABC exporter subunit CydD [Sporosarcina limicola]MBE1555911.1 ATP-binding cassette subfamily C protein CydD [Sporosarcina limicola]
MDKKLLQYKGSKQVMAWVGLLTVAQSIAIVFQAIYLAKAITQLFHGVVWTIALESFAVFAIAHIVRHLCQWGKERIAYRFAEQTALHYQRMLVEKVFEIGPHLIGKHGSGNLVTLALEGIPKFKKYLELFIPRVLSMAIIPAVLLVYVFTMDIMSGVTLLVVMPILIIFLILIGLVSQNKIDAQMDTYRLLSRHFVDSLRGLVTLKYLGRSKAHEQAIATVSDKYRIATNRSLRYAFMSSFSLDFFSSLSIAVVAVELGLRLINGTVFLEPALTILILAPEYFMPVRDLGNDFHATMDGKEASEQIRGILDEKTSGIDNEVTSTSQWSDTSRLTVNGLTKQVDEGQLILKQLNFKVKGFQKIGIVGRSGAGKSTLIDMLSGFTAPTAGEMTLDGVNIEGFGFPDWQNQMMYIPQYPTVFSDTVAGNIRFYEPEASDEEVEHVAKQVGLMALIETFPNGFNEKIGQGGRSLSGGEEQRIAVARSLLQNRSILLFDEPTAHLDIETEHGMKEMLLPILEDKLVFFATHRLHWMENMDSIIVLEDGRIVETGTHDELLHAGGAYACLIEAHRRGMKI